MQGYNPLHPSSLVGVRVWSDLDRLEPGSVGADREGGERGRAGASAGGRGGADNCEEWEATSGLPLVLGAASRVGWALESFSAAAAGPASAGRAVALEPESVVVVVMEECMVYKVHEEMNTVARRSVRRNMISVTRSGLVRAGQVSSAQIDVIPTATFRVFRAWFGAVRHGAAGGTR